MLGRLIWWSPPIVETLTCWRHFFRPAPRVSETMYIVARAGDEALVNAIGRETQSHRQTQSRLSRVASERSTSWSAKGCQIARSRSGLFISEATVKVHVHHVFDKLGIRSRTALAMNAARDRWRQAAPTASSGDDLRCTELSAAKSLDVIDVVRLEVRPFRGAILLCRAREDRLKCGNSGSIKLALDGLSQPKSRDPARHRLSV